MAFHPEKGTHILVAWNSSSSPSLNCSAREPHNHDAFTVNSCVKRGLII